MSDKRTELREKIAQKKRLYDMSTEQLAHRIGLEKRTLQRRMKDPGTFSVKELLLLEKVLKMNLLDLEGLKI